MRIDRRTRWVLAACGVIILGGVAWNVRVKQREADASIFFSKTLQQEHVAERVVVNGIVYSVSEGQVTRADKKVADEEETFDALRIAYALAITRRSPLLSLEGTGPDELERATAELQSVQEELSSSRGDAAEARAVGSALYPIEFLKSAARMERMRHLFLVGGHSGDFETYRLAQIETLRAYGSDAKRFEQAFIEMVPSDAGKLGVAGGKILSRESELDSISGILRSAALMQKALERRSDCISGILSACDANDAALPSVEQSPASDSPDASLALAEEVRNIMTDATVALKPGVTAKQSGKPSPIKFLEISRSSCVGSSSDNHIFIMRKQKNTTGTESFLLTFIGDILITDANSFAGTYYFDYFASKGIRFIPYWPTSTYTCPEIGSESGIALSILSIEDAARTHPFSASLTNNRSQLVQLERTLSNGTLIRESDARRYLALVRESILMDKATPTEAERTYISLAIQLRDRSAGVQDIVYRLAGETRTNMRNERTDVPAKLSAPYLFFARSAFFSLFMGHNRSFAPEQVFPYRLASLPRDEQPYIRYSETRSLVAREKLLHDINYMIRLEGWNY